MSTRKMVPIGATKQVCLMRRTSVWLSLSVECLLFLLGMALAIPAQAQTHAYIVNTGSNSVSVIDTTSNTVVATVSVGGSPLEVAITPDGTRVYVTNGTDNTLSVIDTASNTVVATVGVGAGPTAVAITPDGTRVYVTTGDAVSVIDATSNTVVATVGVSGLGVAITPDGTRAYVATFGPVSVIDTATNTVVATVVLGEDYQNSPIGVAITPDGTRAYFTNSGVASVSGLGSVSVIDTASNIVVATVGVGAFAQGVAITPGIYPPTNKDQCKKGDWKTFTVPRKFKNQGDCVSFVNTRK